MALLLAISMARGSEEDGGDRLVDPPEAKTDRAYCDEACDRLVSCGLLPTAHV
jgi:hypothetical protein